MATTAVLDYVDFRGGYMTSVPDEQMQDNELLVAQNVLWKSGLEKRGGVTRYASITGGDIRGGVRIKMEGVWRTILAVESASATNVSFEIGTAAAFSTLTYPSGTAHAVTAGADFQFAVLGQQAVGVNGTDKERIFYATGSTVFVDTLERYDTRDIDDDYWIAGQYSSTTASGNYATDTAAAQSSASTDFEFQASSTGTGFWVGSDQTFNAITGLDVEASSSVTLTYEYLGQASKGASITWVGVTSVQTPTWTAIGDKVIEWDFPMAADGTPLMQLATSSLGLDSNLDNKYVVRGVNREATLSAPVDGQGIDVQHTQYLSQIMLNQKSNAAATHIDRVWLAADNFVRFSPVAAPQSTEPLKGWQFRHMELFRSAGGSIQQMVPHREYLAVLMDNTIHGIFGTSLNNLTVRRDMADRGAVSPRSAVVMQNLLFFSGRDGIYLWTGEELVNVSKHIQSDIDGWTMTDVASVKYKEWALMSFPTDSIILAFDPDTFRRDDVGDGRVSFYKQTGHAIDGWIPELAQGDNGILLGSDNANVYLVQWDNGAADNIDATATIDMQIQSKYYHFEDFHRRKTFRRARPRISDVATVSGAEHTFKLYTKSEYGEASTTKIITPGVGSGIHVETVGVPPGMHGYNIGFFVQHDDQIAAKFHGVAIEVENRPYV